MDTETHAVDVHVDCRNCEDSNSEDLCIVNTECPICLCNVEPTEESFMFTCNHGIHTDCATEFVYNQFKKKCDIFCPICRYIEFASNCDDYMTSYLRLFPNVMCASQNDELIMPTQYSNDNTNSNIVINNPGSDRLVINIRSIELSIDRFSFRQVILTLCIVTVFIACILCTQLI